MMKILHTADWHIGNFPGPDIDGENARYMDICRCLDHLVITAVKEDPDLIVVSGDIFHQERVWASRGLRENQTAIHYLRLLSKVAPVCVLRGTPNHDGEEQFRSLRAALDTTIGIHIMDEPGVLTIYTGKDGSGDAVNVAALPGFDKGYYRAKHPGLDKEEENAVFTAELETLIMGLKAQCNPAYPSILSTHFTVTGAKTESGQTQLFAQFEPVIEPATLAAADFDLVCLGHIHRPQQLEGCKNTFYSGSVFGLNFNDEGQSRGFYIHEIPDEPQHVPGNNPPIPAVISRFIETPSREFQTLRLNDADISAINNGIFQIGPDVQEKIVRVLYTCTDENNKALNKALLEKTIYDLGAFWVQEITPEKIDIAVNKDALQAESTPEDNLRDYLEEKGVAPERAATYIELARPIIAEALANTATEAKSGLFAPVEIEVRNYRNYREERFEYEGIRFCTINGENGAGKSSLFMDAMLDALFEEPREGDLTGWICNDPDARSGSIKFTFRLGERLFRVTRTRQKSGKATLNLAELVDGEWTDRSKEKFKDTQAEIENTIGVDSLTLKACALIMQDEYGLFLKADREARMTILGNILGLGFYDLMEEKAAESATDANRQVRRANETLEEIERGLPDADYLREEDATIREETEKLVARVRENTTIADGIRLRLNTAAQAAERAAKLSSSIETIAQKKKASEGNLAGQNAIATAAASLLEQEPEITAGVEQYNSLLEQEKELLTGKAQHDAKTDERKRVADELVAITEELRQLGEEESALEQKKAPYERAIVEEADLKQKAEQYEAVKTDIAALEKTSEEYSRLSADALNADREHERMRADANAEYKRRALHITGLKEKAELLKDSGCPVGSAASCRFLSDAIEAEAQIPTEEAALASWKEEQDKILAEAARKREAALEAVKALMYSPEHLTQKRGLLASLEADSRRYGQLAIYKERLREVEHRLRAIRDRSETIRRKSTEYREQLDDIDEALAMTADAAQRFSKLQSEIEAAKKWLDKEKLLPAARERKAAAEARALELLGEIDGYDAEMADKEAELLKEQAAAEEGDTIKTKLAEAERAIQADQDIIQALAKKAGANARKLEEYETATARIKDLREQAQQLAETATGYEELKKAFSQDGIPHNIIRALIPIFEATATNILGQMSGGRMSVEFVTEKVLKSNSKKEVTTLDIVINDAGTGPLPYMSRSGGERVKAALSVILALSEIKSTKAGVQLGFLFVDEPPFLDAPGVQAYCDALEAIQTHYPDLKVMAITHDPAMKSRFPQSVDVVKTAEGSKVIYS